MRTPILFIASLATLILALDHVFVGYPPPGWASPLVALLFAAGLLRRRPLAQQRQAIVALGAICLSLVVLHLVPWPTRDPFLADLFSIRPGMTPAQVEKIMARHQRGTGWPANPLDPSQKGGEFVIPGALVFRPAWAGPGDSDWGIVYLKRGRVTRVEFSPD
jgi:hypothetical protein